MNTQNKLTVLALFGLLSAISLGQNTVLGQEKYIEYGSKVNNDIAHEDILYIIANDEHVYINVVPSQGNGQFALTDLETDYTVDEAIERFGIHEDSNSFVVEKFADISNVGIVYQFNDETLTFQLIGAIEV